MEEVVTAKIWKRAASGAESIVTGIVDCLRAEIDPAEVAHVVLSTVLPSLNKEDITSVRQATPPAVRGRTSRVDAQNSTDASGAKLDRPLPLIVRFLNRSKVDEALNSKSSFTRFNTSDIEHTRLSEKLIKNLYHTNIYINEVMSPGVHIEFKSLKSVSKKLGFKFVWYRHGKFLTRLKEGTQVHAFKSATDLAVIANQYTGNNQILDAIHQPSPEAHSNVNKP